MQRGVVVAGAASIGALRAADLESLGMRGIGEVFTAYRRGDIYDDAEVAVAHADIGDQHAQTIALVNMRSILRQAVSAGILGDCDQEDALTIVRGIYYSERTRGRALHELNRAGLAELAHWIDGRLNEDRNFGDVKKKDAIEALRTCAGPVSGPACAPAPWNTSFHRDWCNFFSDDPSTPGLRYLDRVRYQQIFHRGFPEVWRRFMEFSSMNTSDGAPGMPLERRLADLAALSVEPALLFLPRFDLDNPAHCAVLLAEETAADRANATAYRSAHADFVVGHPRVDPRALHRAAGRSILSELWGIAEQDLEQEYARRGLRSESDAVEGLALFIIGYLQEIALTEREAALHE